MMDRKKLIKSEVITSLIWLKKYSCLKI